MTKNLLVNTSLLICTVFLVRILFFSFFVAAHSNSRQSSPQIKSQFSTVMKRRLRPADESQTQHLRYSTEICEERNFTEENEIVSRHFLPASLLSPFTVTEILNRIPGITLFTHDHSFNSFPRYIVLQVFRTWFRNGIGQTTIARPSSFIRHSCQRPGTR